MLDLKFLRAHPDKAKAALQYRVKESVLDELLAADEAHRNNQQELQEAQSKRNDLSAQIGFAMKSANPQRADVIKQEMVGLKQTIVELELAVAATENVVGYLLQTIPNMVLSDVPVGEDETSNVEIRVVGDKPTFDFTPKEHFDLGMPLGMDFETAGRVSGSRFVFLRGQIARLERALGQFMLDHGAQFGFEEVSVPLMVRKEAMFGTGQLPKFEEDLFKTTDDRYLIPTAEVPLTNMYAGQIVTEEELPIKLMALTPCFRAEAGSAGRDTRGMIRQHQFNKVELVVLTKPEHADNSHQLMLDSVESLLKKLDFHYRVVLLCSGDTGFSACKTYDIEVWMPGQQAYREISSISQFGDFQARRMGARYRPAGETKGTRYLNTLNGSGVAVGRALACLLETHQNEDGSINIPPALVSYMRTPTTYALWNTIK